MHWSMIEDVVYILMFFAAAMVLKRLIPALKRFIIPDSILAGFIGFLLGPNVFNFVQFDVDILGKMIYHLTAIGFIALSLRKPSVQKKNIQYVNTGFIIVATYVFQGILGFVFFWLWNKMDSNVFPILGYLVPMGFGQGPGQAYSIGSQWEFIGVENGGAIGLAIAAAGFAWATVGGIFILNVLLKSRKKQPKIQIVEKREVQVRDYEFSDIDGFTVQLVIIFVVYMAVYGALFLLDRFVFSLSPIGKTFGSVLWGFHFAFGAAGAVVFRRIYEKFHQKGIVHENYINDFLLHRIAGGVFDFMVAASLSAVSIQKISKVLLPLIGVSILAGITTYYFVDWLVKKTMKEKQLENSITLFGNLTGTISTGIALLREIDPALESGASDNLVFGSGVAIFVGLPLLLILGVPPFAITTGNPMYYLYAFLGMVVYFIGMFVFWFRPIFKKNM